MNCTDSTHDWLVPSGLRTTCKRCGRDGHISLDVEPLNPSTLHKLIIAKSALEIIFEAKLLGQGRLAYYREVARLAIDKINCIKE